MITQRFIGQFGNQVIQYFAARIIADVTGLAYVPPPCFVDKAGHPVRWTDNHPLFEMLPVEGRRPKGEPHRIRAQHTFDPETLLECCPDAPIHIEHGYFQSYALLKPYKQLIRGPWFPWRKPPVETDPDAVYIHCRRADYVPGVDNPGDPNLCCLATTMEEYGRCLREFPEAKSLVICTDDPSDPFIQEFAKLDLPWKVSGLPWDEDFRLLASARWMLMSQSSYSWLAGFLGQCERIVCPVFPGTHWHNGLTDDRKPRLYVDDEPERWIWVTE